jgi:hypothetical protein
MVLLSAESEHIKCVSPTQVACHDKPKRVAGSCRRSRGNCSISRHNRDALKGEPSPFIFVDQTSLSRAARSPITGATTALSSS